MFFTEILMCFWLRNLSWIKEMWSLKSWLTGKIRCFVKNTFGMLGALDYNLEDKFIAPWQNWQLGIYSCLVNQGVMLKN